MLAAGQLQSRQCFRKFVFLTTSRRAVHDTISPLHVARGQHGLPSGTEVTSSALAELVKTLSRMSPTRPVSKHDYSAAVVALGKIPPGAFPEAVNKLSIVFKNYSTSNIYLVETCAIKLKEFLSNDGGGGDVRLVISLANHMGHNRAASVAIAAAVEDLLDTMATALEKLPQGVNLLDKDVGDALWGLRNRSAESTVDRRFIGAVTARISSEGDYSGENGAFFGLALNGLQSMSAETVEVQRLLAAMATRLLGHSHRMSGHTISRALHGLQSMSSEQPSVKAMLQALATQLKNCTKLSRIDLCMSLLGIQSMTSECAAVTEVLRELARKAEDLKGPPWTGQALGSALYGMQGISSDSFEGLQLLNCILQGVDTVSLSMTEKAIAMAFTGLQRQMKLTSASRRALMLLGDQLTRGSEPMTLRGLAMMLQSLKTASVGDDEVRFVLAQATERLIRQPIPAKDMTSDGISLAFSGMQAFSSTRVEVRSLLVQLTIMLEAFPLTIPPHQLSHLISGLRGMTGTAPEIHRAFEVIEHKFKSINIGKFTGKDVCFALGGLMGVLRDLESAQRMTWKLAAAIHKLPSMHPLELSRCLMDISGRGCDEEEIRALVGALAVRVCSSSESWGSRDLATALYSMSGMRCDTDETRSLLLALRKKLQAFDGPFSTSQALSMALYGMQGMDPQHKEVDRLLKALYPLLQRSSGLSMDEVQLMSGFLGLKSMTTDSFIATQMLDYMVMQLEGTHNSLSAHAIASILRGVNGMSAEHTSLRRLIVNLTSRLRACDMSDEINLASCFYGLQSMSVDRPVVEDLLIELSLQLERGLGPYNKIFFGSTMLGMRNMSSSHPAVQRLVMMIVKKMEACTQSFDAETISNTLSGLQNLSSRHQCVRRLLATINKKIAESGDEPMTAQGIGDALYGLQSMDADSIEVRELLLLLVNKIELSSRAMINLNPQQAGTAVYGLQGICYTVPSASSLFKLLSGEIETSLLLFRNIPSFDWERWMRVLVQSIVLTIPHVPGMDPMIRARFMDAVPRLSALLQDRIKDATSFASMTEQKTFASLCRHFQDQKNIALSSNQYLMHFEADIVVTVSGLFEKPIMINVEVDGAPSHNLLTSMRFQGRRDAYLRKNGVLVLRLGGHALRNLNKSTVNNSLRQLLLDAELPDGLTEDNRKQLIKVLCTDSDSGVRVIAAKLLDN